ncbi:MAG: sulfotransferase family protein [Bacteroidota bacterium]
MELPKVFVIVCGSSRSGTTMMSRILGNHSSIFAFQELHFFDELASAENASKPISKEKSIELLSVLKSIQREGYFGPRDWKRYAEESETQLIGTALTPMDLLLGFLTRESMLHGKLIPCEQTPQTVFALDALLQHVPTARVILMVRDPREVLLSQKGKWKRRKLSGGNIPFWESVRSRINYHPETISRIWKSTYNEALQHIHDNRVLSIRYEDLTEQPEQIVKRICNHLGIEFESSMLDVPKVGSSNAADQTLERGIDKGRRGKWKSGLNRSEVAICERANRELMLHFGYELSGENGNAIQMALYRLLLPFQLVLALMMNLKRLRNIRKAFRRLF